MGKALKIGGAVVVVVFVLFLIFGDPARSGETVGSFFSWVGDGFSKFLIFLRSIIG